MKKKDKIILNLSDEAPEPEAWLFEHALNATVPEWNSPEDEDAFKNLENKKGHDSKNRAQIVVN